MPGRHSQGRAPLQSSNGPINSSIKTQNPDFFRSRAAEKALNAYPLASDLVPEGEKNRGKRQRALESSPVDWRGGSRADLGQKRNWRINDDYDKKGRDDEKDADGDEGRRPRKRTKKGIDSDDFGSFSGSDSEGNEWHEGVGEGEDSDIDSDEAFGEDDEVHGCIFRGSSTFLGKGNGKKSVQNQRRGELDEEEDDESEESEGIGDDGESLGSDAIDLVQAMDMSTDDESDHAAEGLDSSGSADEDTLSESEESDDEAEENPADSLKLAALIAEFGGASEGADEREEDLSVRKKTKISLEDLGLSRLKDPNMRKSVKLMGKEEKETRPGASKKLAVPLPKRQQDKLDRSAAFAKTSETLDRWTETVKMNRRADHLMFPLAQEAPDYGLNHDELMPLTQKRAAGNELEQTILAIMEESGLGPGSEPKEKNKKRRQGGDEGEGGNGDKGISLEARKEMLRQKRFEREMYTREQVRNKRIKKIKSKIYRRIHRKELLRDEETTKKAMLEAGEIDSEEEREAMDRRRAEERMGTRHKESKWAKLGKKAGRAIWDDDFRFGLAAMARRKDELMRRVEGRANGGGADDEESDDDSGSEDSHGKDYLLKKLEEAAAYDNDEPQSNLMKMKFMQRGEAARKQENDELVAQIRRNLDGSGDEEDDENDEESGRRQYGTGAASAKTCVAGSKSDGVQASTTKSEPKTKGAGVKSKAKSKRESEVTEPGAAGAWSRDNDGQRSQRKKKLAGAHVPELDLTKATITLPVSEKKIRKSKPKEIVAQEADVVEESDASDAIHLPMAVRDLELVKRAFAGDDVVMDFEQEKAAAEDEDEEKEVDTTLPGWGDWIGAGIKPRKRNKNKDVNAKKNMNQSEGIKKANRKDATLKKVIISEKRIKRNDKYFVPELPFPFQSAQQYESSLRLPIGSEWVTRQTFNETIKPRVIIKQGIIAPMSKPMA